MTRETRSKSSSARTYAVGFAVVLGALLGLVVAGEPAAGDLLVLHGGGEIETDGPWRVDGRRVLFETPTGRYSSLRVSEVDLEASHRRTRQAEDAGRRSATEAEPAPRATRPEPRWVITDEDVSSVQTVREQPPPVPQVIGDEDFDVLSLRQEVDATGFHLVVRGTLVNRGSEFKEDLVVQVRLVDPRSGGAIATSPAAVDTQLLPPGGATRFTARFANTAPDTGMVQVQAMQAEDEAFLGS